MAEFTSVKGTADRLEKLEAFFEEVGDLTSNHETLHDHAVVYPSDLGKALEKVDPDWWRSKASSIAAETEQPQPLGHPVMPVIDGFVG